MRLKMENAGLSEIYGKHDGRQRSAVSNQDAIFIKANLKQSSNAWNVRLVPNLPPARWG
jgi:hypothetical protein